MRRAVAALLACLVLASCTADPETAGVSPGGSHVDVDTPELRAVKARAGVAGCPAGQGSSELPDVTLRCLGGGPDVDLSTLRGPLVINLFAQWCGPCRKELPYYEALHQKAKGAVRVVGVDYLDTQPARALALVKQTGVTYPLVADPLGELRGPLRIRFTPSIVFLRRDGSVEVVARSVRSYAELRGLVQQELDVRLPA